MKFMPWHKAKRFVQYLKLDFPRVKEIATRSAHSPTFHGILRKDGSATPLREKRFTQKYLGHHPRFWLFIPLPLSVMLGRDTTFLSQKEDGVRLPTESHRFDFPNVIFGKNFLIPCSKIPKNRTAGLHILRGL